MIYVMILIKTYMDIFLNNANILNTQTINK